MELAVEVAAGDRRTVTVADDATATDVLRAVGFGPREAAVLVDGRPVPADAPVEADAVTVVRLVAGGAAPARWRPCRRLGPGRGGGPPQVMPAMADGRNPDTPVAPLPDIQSHGTPTWPMCRLIQVSGRGAISPADHAPGVQIRPATPAEHADVLGVIQGNLLAVTPEQVRAGEPLVAVAESRVLGVLVLAGERIVAVAVRPGRRNAGIGSALVSAAATRRDRLVAEFHVDLRPFYSSLGFSIRPAGDPDRLCGVLDRPEPSRDPAGPVQPGVVFMP